MILLGQGGIVMVGLEVDVTGSLFSGPRGSGQDRVIHLLIDVCMLVLGISTEFSGPEKTPVE